MTKRLTTRWIGVAFSLSAFLAAPHFAPAQSASKARRVANAEFGRFKWPTYRQVKTSTSVPQVKVIQFLLRNRGFYKSQPDGVFGANTAHAVRAFQRANSLKSDGVMGAQTWRLLLLRLKRGDGGDAVRALQTMLRETTGHEAQFLTRDLPVDGVFGAQTENALRIAQESANWFEKRAVVDGSAGPQIWSIILANGAQP